MDASLAGLSSAEARRRQAEVGRNEIGSRDAHGLLQTLRSVAAEPMFDLLLLAAGVYLAIGDLGEGLLLAFFALVTVGLVIYQERRSERALDALRDLAAPQARVVRDGRVQRIPALDLVPGDLVLVAEGERVPADVVLAEATGLSIDESLLTGESVPVRKRAATADEARPPAVPGGDDQPFAYASTLVVAGHGFGEVTRIGRDTRVGGIGSAITSIAPSATPLELHLRWLVRAFGIAAAGVSVFLLLWYGVRSGQWVQGLLAGLALAMAMLPEEFPMVFAVFLALGAWRLARVQVLARRPAVIEALGAATLLCVDKTGTLTENRMRLRWLATRDGRLAPPDGPQLSPDHRALLEAGRMASRPRTADPMEQAILAVADRQLGPSPGAHGQARLERDYALQPELLAMTLVWRDGEGTRHVAAKGAVEAICELCRLSDADARALARGAGDLAEAGLRVLAVARGTLASETLPLRQRDIGFEPLGLLAFEDPLRASVAPAVAQARAAGIAVAMITGDHDATALAVAKQAGIETAAGALTGRQMDALDDAGLRAAVGDVRVFARIQPEQKLRLVRAFAAIGETVAMTGDGVNDAPALKAAHIGIAMGARGTDVAREAAGLVLLDDDFGHIVAGVRMGRRIFDNLRRVMIYITAIHVPIAGLALLPVLLGLPPLLLPVHVVLTEMVVDPACSLAFEGAPDDADVMARPPRAGDASLVGWSMLWRGLLQGSALLAAALVAFAVEMSRSGSEEAARTCAVAGLTLGNLLLVAVDATAGQGLRALLTRDFPAFWAVALVAASTIAAAITWPPLRALLHFGVPPALDLVATLAACAASVLLVRPLVGMRAKGNHRGLPSRRRTAAC
jgi:Ca2+-transporting ATPase